MGIRFNKSVSGINSLGCLTPFLMLLLAGLPAQAWAQCRFTRTVEGDSATHSFSSMQECEARRANAEHADQKLRCRSCSNSPCVCSGESDSGGGGGSTPVFNFPKPVDLKGIRQQKEAQSQQYKEMYQRQKQAEVSAFGQDLKSLIQQKLANLEKRRKKEDAQWEAILKKLEQERNARRARVDSLWEKNKGRIPEDMPRHSSRGAKNISLPQLPLPPDPGATLEQFQQHELDMNKYMFQMNAYYKGQVGLLKQEIAVLKRQEARLLALGDAEKSGQQASAEAQAKPHEDADSRKSALEARKKRLNEKIEALVGQPPLYPGDSATARDKMLYEFRKNKYDDQLADYRRQMNSTTQELNSLQAQGGAGLGDKPLEIKRVRDTTKLVIPMEISGAGSKEGAGEKGSEPSPEIRRVQPPAIAQSSAQQGQAPPSGQAPSSSVGRGPQKVPASLDDNKAVQQLKGWGGSAEGQVPDVAGAEVRGSAVQQQTPAQIPSEGPSLQGDSPQSSHGPPPESAASAPSSQGLQVSQAPPSPASSGPSDSGAASRQPEAQAQGGTGQTVVPNPFGLGGSGRPSFDEGAEAASEGARINFESGVKAPKVALSGGRPAEGATQSGPESIRQQRRDIQEGADHLKKKDRKPNCALGEQSPQCKASTQATPQVSWLEDKDWKDFKTRSHSVISAAEVRYSLAAALQTAPLVPEKAPGLPQPAAQEGGPVPEGVSEAPAPQEEAIEKGSCKNIQGKVLLGPGVELTAGSDGNCVLPCRNIKRKFVYSYEVVKIGADGNCAIQRKAGTGGVIRRPGRSQPRPKRR